MYLNGFHKLGSHRDDEFHRPASSPVINLVETIEGSSPNLHRGTSLSHGITFFVRKKVCKKKVSEK